MQDELPGSSANTGESAPAEASATAVEDLTPAQVVAELDRYIIGQHDAKRAVAIAMRNRWRRQRVDPALRNEIYPKNIIMIGPTGVGKTEIARRLARLVRAPFVKVEASKFTEVGYVGRDVESMIRDLVEVAVGLVKREEALTVHERARQRAERVVLDKLFGPETPPAGGSPASATVTARPAYEQTPAITAFAVGPGGQAAPVRVPVEPPAPPAGAPPSAEERLARLRAGAFDERRVVIEVQDGGMPMMQVFSNAGMEEMGVNLQELFENTPFGRRPPRKREVPVPEALAVLTEQEEGRLIDRDKVQREALRRVEEGGIVFVDEIDKIASREGGHHGGPDVSREGVQRDILPIVEGSAVTTKYGVVRTDHILFIAAGAFHVTKVSDLIPELQGRFPIRVELTSLGEEDFFRILTEPDNALVKQYVALLATEGVTLEFCEEGLRELARLAAQVNTQAENIGARRLYTVLERLLDELSFEAPARAGQAVRVDRAYIEQHLRRIVEDQDLSRYIL